MGRLTGFPVLLPCVPPVGHPAIGIVTRRMAMGHVPVHPLRRIQLESTRTKRSPRARELTHHSSEVTAYQLVAARPGRVFSLRSHWDASRVHRPEPASVGIEWGCSMTWTTPHLVIDVGQRDDTYRRFRGRPARHSGPNRHRTRVPLVGEGPRYGRSLWDHRRAYGWKRLRAKVSPPRRSFPTPVAPSSGPARYAWGARFVRSAWITHLPITN